MAGSKTAMKNGKKVRGFSLIEVLFSVFMVVVCAGIVAATMPVATNAHVRADNYSKALNLAQEQLETIRGNGFANATVGQLCAYGLIDNESPVATNTYTFSNTSAATPANLDSPAKVLQHGSGTIMVQLLNFNLTQVVVTVSWRDQMGNHSVQLGTLIANL